MPRKKKPKNQELILGNSTQDIQITFEVTEVEYDRAEGAQVSIDLKHPNMQVTLHGFWWHRYNMAFCIEQWEEGNTDAKLETDEVLLQIAKSDYSDQLAVGLKIEDTFGQKLNAFPLGIALSFEVSKTSLKQFFDDLKILESNCRPY